MDIKMNEEIKKIKITDIFSDKYIVPIYQRKYSWTEKEIEQLLEDIIYNNSDNSDNSNNKYFLGTLTVDKKDDGRYEVIDGQQRLTTLSLIMIYLNKHIDDLNINIDNMPSFEARQIYDNALNALKNMKENEEISAYDNAKEIYEGYRCIENYFKSNDKNKFLDNMNTTLLVRVQVPENTDLNHYFEIMNTRGEQLELHHIAKAKFLEAINDSNDKRTASIIWDACSQMNRYVQMSFKPEIRKKLFEEDLSDFKEDVLDWDTLKSIFNTTADNEDIKTLKAILDDNSDKQVNENKDKNNTDEKPERFESIITFPYFLLHLNAVIQDSSEEDSLYDDKKLLINLAKHYENKDKESAKKFISNMLKCRFLFDKYIVKRDYQDDDNNLKLSLLKYKYKDSGKPYLVNTYGKEEDESTQEPLKILQSLLRITYTSPRTMKWITTLLKHLFDGKDAGLESVINVLENHCIEKIKKFYVCETKEFTEEDFNKQTGFNIERIVFTYLDYLLYRDGYKGIIEPKFSNWKVQFRNSIEHFYPQNPEHQDRWGDDILHCFGNLALITVSDNSKFSNLNPKAKVEQYKDKDIIQQNPKLKIMAKITEMEGWTEEKAKEHQKEMFEILSKEINGKNSNI